MNVFLIAAGLAYGVLILSLLAIFALNGDEN